MCCFPFPKMVFLNYIFRILKKGNQGTERKYGNVAQNSWELYFLRPEERKKSLK